MRRATNGGGENSPLLVGEDDYYELFLEDLAGMVPVLGMLMLRKTVCYSLMISVFLHSAFT